MEAPGFPDGAGHMTPRSGRLGPLRKFVATENASALTLLVATLLALLWANSPWSEAYFSLLETEIALRFGGRELAMDLQHWVNDGLMAFFFFVIGLEIRREFDMGELRERRRVAVPVLAALGGIVLPAGIYLALNAGRTSAAGWGIPIGTDTAFALGVMSLIAPTAWRARAFLLTSVIVDDIIALAVIALAYTEDLSTGPLLVAAALYALILGMRRAGVAHGGPYFAAGVALWLATLASGVHATLAGVAVGLLASAYPPRREELDRAARTWRLFREQPTPRVARSAARVATLAVSPNERLQHLFHPWTSFVVVPLFAFSNAGLHLSGELLHRAAGSPVTLGVFAGLVGGKLAGVAGTAWLASRLGGWPLTVGGASLLGIGAVSGIGFTVALLISEITFEGALLAEAKVGIFAASLSSSALAWLVYRAAGLVRGRAVPAPPITDLSEPVDPEVDHIRGPAGSPVVLVEYGDFECPYCGRIESALRELVRRHGDDLAFVFRHLPLDDVHPHARLAAEASEAADAQGKFWEMHDLLMDGQAGLSEEAVVGYAHELGLDLERFLDDLRNRRHAARVERDVRSAEDSGAVGTPTFFLNGRRYQGIDEAPVLMRLVEAELAARRRISFD